MENSHEKHTPSGVPDDKPVRPGQYITTRVLPKKNKSAAITDSIIEGYNERVQGHYDFLRSQPTFCARNEAETYHESCAHTQFLPLMNECTTLPRDIIVVIGCYWITTKAESCTYAIAMLAESIDSDCLPPLVTVRGILPVLGMHLGLLSPAPDDAVSALNCAVTSVLLLPAVLALSERGSATFHVFNADRNTAPPPMQVVWDDDDGKPLCDWVHFWNTCRQSYACYKPGGRNNKRKSTKYSYAGSRRQLLDDGKAETHRTLIYAAAGVRVYRYHRRTVREVIVNSYKGECVLDCNGGYTRDVPKYDSLQKAIREELRKAPRKRKSEVEKLAGCLLVSK